MGPPRRKMLATAEETLTPPDSLSDTQQIVRAIKATGNNIYLIEHTDKSQVLVELPARFRSTIWIKRGSYVVVDTKGQEERDNKIRGEIVNVVRDEKAWRKAPFWYVLNRLLIRNMLERIVLIDDILGLRSL
jgi:probable RNA-binding protein EIF1AD